ncbi:MAG: putative HTH-type transcriptional regulator YgaV [Candidatus Anoxychlamydiales bacterium]|nr:putative HTH-type transcriptional regulator YgaV [Candidatus Anoxychlamydiales bacterium]
MLTNSSFLKASNCLKTIAHPKRLKMIYMLLEKSRTVKELAEACKVRHNVASTHLTIMKDRNLVSSKKVNREVIYSVKEKALQNILKCIENKFG